jgi:GPH family glycoside/pentoside/hexuronide:cation symporter
MLIVFLTLSSFAGSYPVPSAIQGAVLSILIAIPLAVFTVVPNAIVADFAVAAEKKTGAQRSGMYFGVHSLVMKSGQLFATLLFPLVMSVGSLSSHGATRVGLRATLILSAIFSFIGFCALFGYREKEVAALLDKKD